MDLGLTGKRALVTGGTRGIGRATVELLAAEGASVAFCARNEEAVEAFAAELRGAGVTVFARAIDVSKEDQLKGFIRDAAENLGGLDILVSNVTGGSIKGPEQWQQSLELDLLPLVHLIDEATPILEAAGGGSIIALSSTFGFDNVWPSSPNSYGARSQRDPREHCFTRTRLFRRGRLEQNQVRSSRGLRKSSCINSIGTYGQAQRDRRGYRRFGKSGHGLLRGHQRCVRRRHDRSNPVLITIRR